MKRILSLFFTVLCCSSAAHSQPQTPGPLRLAIAELTHTYVHGILSRPDRGDIRIVGIQEPDRKLVDRYAKQHGFRDEIVVPDLEKMLDTVKPEPWRHSEPPSII